MSEGTLPHQSWDSDTNQWIQRRSPPQPNIEVTVSTHREDYLAHGHTLREERHHLTTTALADTGCQSCLAGQLLLTGLNLRKADLIPATLLMSSASGTNLPILGAALIRIRSRHSNRETRQMVYFSPLATKLYLSLATCSDLGLIAKGFPLCTSTPPTASGTSTWADQPLSQVQDLLTRTGDLQTRTIHRVPRRIQMTATADLQARPPGPLLPTTPLVSQTNPPIPRACSCPTRAPPPDRPTSLPFPGTEENRHRLERYLLDLYSASAFNVCEHQPLPKMSGPPLSLSIDPNAVPKPCHTPIAIPIHWQDEVKAGLDRDVRLGVLEKVTPVTWCHRMVICTKKDGSLRRTINFQPLNQYATRETHHCPSPFHQAQAIPCRTKKTIFDALNGYHSVALSKEDRHFTTFITPWGRYRYLTAPQGYIASGDAYTARYDALVANVRSKTKCIDDALLWSDDITGAFHQATEWLHICAVNGITLNPRKFRFAEDKVEFAGFTVTPLEVKPADKYTQAISDFPTPTSITDIRAWWTKSHTSSRWPRPCNLSGLCSSPPPHLNGRATLPKPSLPPNSTSASASGSAFRSLTRTAQPAWPPTGARTGSGSGCFKNTASAHPVSCSAARRVGVSLWWARASHMQLSPDMPPWKGRLLPLLMPWTRLATSSSGAAISL